MENYPPGFGQSDPHGTRIFDPMDEPETLGKSEIDFINDRIWSNDEQAQRLRTLVLGRMRNRSLGDQRKSEFIKEILGPWTIDQFNRLNNEQKKMIIDSYYWTKKLKIT